MKSFINICLFILLFTLSCNEKEEPLFLTFDRMTFITVLDIQGKNLLDPKHEKHYKLEDIKIFYDRNGNLEEFYQGHLDMPRNFRIDPPELGRDYKMALVLDSEKTVIQWNKTESDTIQAEFLDNDANAEIVIKVFLNGELKWDGETATKGRGFTIVKDR
ncbi:MAG: hypothetical protein ACQEW9_07145 [Bacteroidota bacterium]